MSRFEKSIRANCDCRRVGWVSLIRGSCSNRFVGSVRRRMGCLLFSCSRIRTVCLKSRMVSCGRLGWVETHGDHRLTLCGRREPARFRLRPLVEGSIVFERMSRFVQLIRANCGCRQVGLVGRTFGSSSNRFAGLVRQKRKCLPCLFWKIPTECLKSRMASHERLGWRNWPLAKLCR